MGLLTRPRRRRLLGLVAASALLALPARRVHGQTTSDARVKARLTANLARYTTWPAGPGSGPGDALLICAWHRSGPVGAAFDELNGAVVGGRSIKISHNPPTPASCHVAYVDAAVDRPQALLSSLATLAVLTVGDAPGYLSMGMVELANVNDSIRFDVHLARIRRANLDISSQVLKLARRVED